MLTWQPATTTATTTTAATTTTTTSKARRKFNVSAATCRCVAFVAAATLEQHQKFY